MNLFASDPFLGALGRAAFPGRRCAPGYFRVGESVFRLLTVDGRPVRRFPLLEFHEPCPPEGAAELRLLGYLPRVCVAYVDVDTWTEALPALGLEPAPLVSWAEFPGWEPFQAHLEARSGTLLHDSVRRRRMLERDLGPIELQLADVRPGTFDQCLSWKSAQLASAHLRDPFAAEESAALLRELRQAGVLTVASLSAGGVLLATHVGARQGGRFYYWITSYDPVFARYSPGRLLLHALLEHSCRAGDREFDFLLGGDRYKWSYATHVRAIGDCGTAPLHLRARRAALTGVQSTLHRLPWARARVQEAGRRRR